MTRAMPTYQLVVQKMDKESMSSSLARVLATRKVVRAYHSPDQVVVCWIVFSVTTLSIDGRRYSRTQSYVGLLIIEHPPPGSWRRAARDSYRNWRNIPLHPLSPSGTRLLELLLEPVRESRPFEWDRPSGTPLVEPIAWSFPPSILRRVFVPVTPSPLWFETLGSWWSQSAPAGDLLSGYWSTKRSQLLQRWRS